MSMNFNWIRKSAWLVFGIALLVSCGKDSQTDEPSSPTDVVSPTDPPSEAFELLPGTVVINEVMPIGEGGQPAWAEFTNIDSVPVPVAGALLSDEDGNTYVFPADIPMIQPESFFIVFFDGQDEAELEGDQITFHTDAGMVNPFDEAGDQLALYANRTQEPRYLVDFVAWGSPPQGEDAAAVEAGMWLEGAYTNSERGGVITGFSQPGESIGIFPEKPAGWIDSWVVYSESEATPGARNGVPTTDVTLPNTGALLLNQDFRLAWYNVPFAVEYQLQIDDDAEFGSPEVDVTLDEPYYISAPSDGTYFWRIKAIAEDGMESPFSPTSEFTVATLEPLSLPEEPIEGVDLFPVRTAHRQGGSTWTISYSPSTAPEAQASFWEVDYLNSLAPILQRKDSDMICWDGDDESGARKPWDGPHADTPGNHANHGRAYCARASIAMINHYYGGDLSQDRLSYEHFGGDGWPVGDLGHNKGLAIPDGRDLLSWSLNNAPVTLTYGKPTFAQIQAWTRNRIAVKAGIPGHAITLRGWAIYTGSGARGVPTGTQFVIFNDPWDGRMHVQSYASLALTETDVPGGSPTGRKEETSVKEDPDGDDIVTFDENNRFGTNFNDDDTDQDCITDQLDMHSFLYTTHDSYSPSVADKDGDGLHKHVDSDNDDGGVIDGDEDGNWNGHLDDRETDNFDAADDPRAPRTCKPPATPTSVTMPPTPEEPIDEVLIGVVVTILYDEAGHGPFINMPGYLELLMNFINGTVNGPFPWVPVSGTVDDQGGIMAQGMGTVAGYTNVTVTFEGTYTEEGLVAEYTMGVNGGLPGGIPITYGIEGSRIDYDQEATPDEGDDQEGATPTPGEPAVEDTPPQGTVSATSFYSDFNTAFAEADVDRLVGLLHPAVIDLYGADACQAYLEGLVDNTIHVTVEEVLGFGVWNWQIDGRQRVVEDVFTVAINVTVGSEMNSGQSHLGVLQEGSLGWFTDCGDPLG